MKSKRRVSAPPPPIAGEADAEYQPRLDAQLCTLQFGHKLQPRAPQEDIEDLPLFGSGKRQNDLFTEGTND
jgi:hypothetical protein